MYAPPGEARNAISVPTSSGVPSRPSGTLRAHSATSSASYWSSPSVRIDPGAMQTLRMPNRLHSSARLEARLPDAARAAIAWAKPGIPRSGLRPMKTTSPRRAGIMARVAAVRVSRHTASTLSRATAPQPLSEIVSAGAANWPPALLTSTSSAPKRPSAASTIRSAASSSRTSSASVAQAPPAAAISSATRARGSVRRPQISTDEPLPASASAVARPIPVPPPVTTATRPAVASGASGEEAMDGSLRASQGRLDHVRRRRARTDARRLTR